MFFSRIVTVKSRIVAAKRLTGIHRLPDGGYASTKPPIQRDDSALGSHRSDFDTHAFYRQCGDADGSANRPRPGKKRLYTSLKAARSAMSVK